MSVPEKLQVFFQQNPKLALGFSGGVDSSYLLYAAKACGADVKPYFIKSQFQPRFELEDAIKLSQQLGVELQIIELDLTAHEQVLNNPADRCYHCKKLVFEQIIQQARQDGYQVFIDGNNASDDDRDRPGMKAVKELAVLSPLREAGLTKDDVRELSWQADLFTWNKPSYACLATRIPTGTAITQDGLEKVEQAEDRLFELGFYDYRIRVMDTTAKLQLPPDQMARALELRETILDELSPYFNDVVLDLKAR
ncbi:MAG TPA: ATP-dependent sacrificial sulfur transferase LarE [Tissierellia bacterium]|nr:ATP-dependent sacrificial sulfur transferase LarE [Tissierellia bacterium]